MSKQSLHSIFSWNYPNIRDIPRVFVFDSCEGTQHMENNGDKRKNFDIGDVALMRDNTMVWKQDEANPDYKLCVIHAANPSFQANINTLTGSYLVYMLTKQMMLNLQKKDEDKMDLLGEIDEIQHYLHDDLGKQQITFSFNNHTRYLKFVKNNKPEIDLNENQDIKANEEIKLEEQMKDEKDIKMIDCQRKDRSGCTGIEKEQAYMMIE